MGAKGTKHQVSLARWSERVEDCRKSGMTVREWCRGQGITPKTYYRWEREVQGAAGKQQTAQEESTEFVELKMPKPESVTVEAEQSRVARLHTGSVILDIYTGADPETLRGIIEVLKYAQ